MKLLAKFLKFLFLGIGLLVLLTIVMYGYRDIPINELKAKYAPAPSQFVAVDGMEVHYRDQGIRTDSIPIVLIHGTGASLHTFEDWVKGLDTTRRVICMDLPGYGLTGAFPDRDYTGKNYVAFIKDFLDALGIKKCILGGNSLGGRIAWNVTAAHPERVEQLILIDASGYPAKSKSIPLAFSLAKVPVIKNLFTFITPPFIARSSIENVYADKSKVSDELAQRYFDLTLRKGNRQAFVDKLNTSVDTTAYLQIKSISQRTLILWGEKDNLIPIEQAYRFHNDLPNDTLVILKNVGHMPMEESPKESLEVLLSFLGE